MVMERAIDPSRLNEHIHSSNESQISLVSGPNSSRN